MSTASPWRARSATALIAALVLALLGIVGASPAQAGQTAFSFVNKTAGALKVVGKTADSDHEFLVGAPMPGFTLAAGATQNLNVAFWWGKSNWATIRYQIVSTKEEVIVALNPASGVSAAESGCAVIPAPGAKRIVHTCSADDVRSQVCWRGEPGRPLADSCVKPQTSIVLLPVDHSLSYANRTASRVEVTKVVTGGTRGLPELSSLGFQHDPVWFEADLGPKVTYRFNVDGMVVAEADYYRPTPTTPGRATCRSIGMTHVCYAQTDSSVTITDFQQYLSPWDGSYCRLEGTRVEVDASDLNDLPEHLLAFQHAMAEWEDNSGIDFVVTPDATNFGVTVGTVGTTQHGGFTRPYCEGGIITQAIVTVSPVWLPSDSHKRSLLLKAVWTHELGHMLGLQHQTAVPSMMYPDLSAALELELWHITPYDIAAAQLLYGK